MMTVAGEDVLHVPCVCTVSCMSSDTVFCVSAVSVSKLGLPGYLQAAHKELWAHRGPAVPRPLVLRLVSYWLLRDELRRGHLHCHR